MLTRMAGAEDRAVERAVRVAKERARDDVQLLVAAGASCCTATARPT